MCESGSDSGSSTGSVRASRGSWGSWSSASSMEGDRDSGARTHACTTSSRKSKDGLFCCLQNIYPQSRIFDFSFFFFFNTNDSNTKYNVNVFCFCFSGEPMYAMYPAERDCYQTMNTNYKAVR